MVRSLGPRAGPIGRATGCALKPRHSRMRRTSPLFHQACCALASSLARPPCFVFLTMRVCDNRLAQVPRSPRRVEGGQRRGDNRTMKAANKSANREYAAIEHSGARTLSIDIGGTGLKASVLDGAGRMLVARV